MGKVRAKTIGDESLEREEKLKAQKRREVKKLTKESNENGPEAHQPLAEAEKRRLAKIEVDKKEIKELKETKETKTEKTAESVVQNETKPEPKPKKKIEPKKERSEKYKTAASLIEKSKLYSLSEALDLLEKIHLTDFDETVELHINALNSLNGSMNLPHGTGKTTKVAILSPLSDATEADTLLKKIESGKIEFDVLIATPDAMPRLAKVAKILGPRGLMPNPKNGTISPKPEIAAKQFEGGNVRYKTEAKAPVLHLVVGKMSFGKDNLSENIKVVFKTIETKNMKKAVLKSTMSPAIRLSI